jgi:hypothetical protein
MTEQRRDPNKGMRFAREPVVVIVGARAPTYEQVPIRDNRTGEIVMMNKDQPSDPGSEGISYSFRQYQRVAATHPAVKESPGSFMTADEMSDAELELVTA